MLTAEQALEDLYGIGGYVTTSEIIRRLERCALQSAEEQALDDALTLVAGERGRISPRRLGWYFKHFNGRVVDDKKLHWDISQKRNKVAVVSA